MLSDVAAAPMEMTLLGIQGKVLRLTLRQACMQCILFSMLPCLWSVAFDP